MVMKPMTDEERNASSHADLDTNKRATAECAREYSDLWTWAYVHAADRLRTRVTALSPEYMTAGIDYSSAAARIADATLDEYRTFQHRKHYGK